jgi:hypothetical protein
MRVPSRGKTVSMRVTGLVLITLIASSALFISRQSGMRPPRAASRPLAFATQTSGVTVRFNPRPGVTVIVRATPSDRASAGDGQSGDTSPTAVPKGSIASPPGQRVENSALMTQSPTALDSYNYTWTELSFRFINTGSTIWDGAQGYSLKCFQTCWSGWYSPNSTFTVLHDQAHTFTAYMLPSPSSFYYTIDRSIWQLWSPTTGFFGEQAVVTVVNHGWSLAFQEASPSCESGDGSQWVQEGSAGTVSCDSSGLALAQGGSGGVALLLQSTSPAYDYGNYVIKTHIHFTSSSSTTFAGVILSAATSANGGFQTVFMVSPAGYYCEAELLSYCAVGGIVYTLPPSSDYDFFIEVYNSGKGFVSTANGVGPGGGLNGGGATGLIETTAAGSTDAAYFSNYQLYQPK